MAIWRRRVYLSYFILHLALVSLICAHEMFWVLGDRSTITPAFLDGWWKIVDRLPATMLGEDVAARSSWSNTVATYTNLAGIEAGYGFFAPNVPITHALIFECRYSDGRVDYQAPVVQGEAAQLRLTSLIEQIARTDYPPWRDELITQLARSIWGRRPQPISMRAFFGSITPPTLADYGAGKRERIFTFLYVYDFSRDGATAQRPTR